MTRIKFCGMTRIDDALAAAALGVDAVGLVFTARSSRRIDVEQGRAIRAALPPFVSSVALFMDDDAEWIAHVVDIVQPDLLQFHGSEDEAACIRHGRPYMKAIGMSEGVSALARLRAYPASAALLLDGHGLGQPGGSGQSFDWSQMPTDLEKPLVLAGGLHAGNVGRAIAIARPDAVDVSSGIEFAPGVKDVDAMRAFVQAVREADRQLAD